MDGAQEDNPNETIRLDLRGLKCPLPALHTRRALERASAGALITVECSDPMAAIDIPHLAATDGHRLEAQQVTQIPLVFVIRKRSDEGRTG